MGNPELPVAAPQLDGAYSQPTGPRRQCKRRFRGAFLLLAVFALGAVSLFSQRVGNVGPVKAGQVPPPAVTAAALARCSNLHVLPGPSKDFYGRKASDRFTKGTPPLLIRNATVWTGRIDGLEVLNGADVLLANGIIQAVGHVGKADLDKFAGENLVSYNVQGAFVTPGIVDLHSHLGVYSAPSLSGSSDGNSLHGPTLPWLRSLDGLNTHDDAYKLSISGGVTTAVILPGSANAIGGQAFSIKLRPTAERTSSSMLLEPPFQINGSIPEDHEPPRWRQMKHACGENPSRVYGFTRMDTIWSFRKIYDEARQIRDAQDAYCSAATTGKWAGLGAFPENLQYEAIVDVLRGRVKVHTHCYETVDLDGLARLTQEFKFPVAAVHHAHEAYLVPDRLKSMHGGAPAAAIFATHGRYKREAYRGSEFAAKVLSEAGIRVVMKSDHPVLNSRDLIYEAQQAHYWGLAENLALASVTTTPASVMGLDYRIGYLKNGYDADVVVWDSHPLALGATPQQVIIDGIPQLDKPYLLTKAKSFQEAPKTPSWNKEAADAVKYDGLPPLVTDKKSVARTVLFTNVSSVFVPQDNGADFVEMLEVSTATSGHAVALVQDGKLTCAGTRSICASALAANVEIVDLEGGALQPALTAFGPQLGLVEIQGEASTQDGVIPDPLLFNQPEIIKGEIVRAIDGLQFETRDALLAYRSGVTTAITAPLGAGLISGLSTVFNTGAAHKLASEAIIVNEAGLHVTLSLNSPVALSAQVGALRRMLVHGEKSARGAAFEKAAKGELTLVVKAHSADVIASLLSLKAEVEEAKGSTMKLTITGATEAHLLAPQLAKANVGVVLVSFRQFPSTWQDRRILAGPPVTQRSALGELLAHNVDVAIGVKDAADARALPFMVGWAALEADGALSKKNAYALASTNVQRLLGADVEAQGVEMDLVVTRGGDFISKPFEAKVIGVVSAKKRVVDMF